MGRKQMDFYDIERYQALYGRGKNTVLGRKGAHIKAKTFVFFVSAFLDKIEKNRVYYSTKKGFGIIRL
ncbi:hypothetical protein IF2G_07041 [Cordyceps javanica]|nr:hypothetical protein IF2G_07041 [Cordyceps javanica]